MAGNATWLRHGLATLAYRFAKSIREAPPGFGDFDPGSGVRTPNELARHLTQLARGMRSRIAGGPVERPEPVEWAGEVARFYSALEDVDQALEEHADPLDETGLALLQGPLSDALTHVGQIAMLRRMAGSPVSGENFSKAGVERGRVGADQPLPTEPFRD